MTRHDQESENSLEIGMARPGWRCTPNTHFFKSRTCLAMQKRGGKKEKRALLGWAFSFLPLCLTQIDAKDLLLLICAFFWDKRKKEKEVGCLFNYS